MIVIYFSGTGNTKYCAERFAKKMNARCSSIENDLAFIPLLADHQQIAVFYPIYGSHIPRIMREFIEQYKESFTDKKIMIFCTQMYFSGDGARVLTDLLGDIDYQVIYAEHINMPNNIPNVFFLPLKKDKDIKITLRKADEKIDKACNNIVMGKVITRGFNPCSKYSGLLIQRIHFNRMEKKLHNAVQVTDDCTACDICCKECPMENLYLENGQVQQNDNCTLCFRCVNICPTKSITVWMHMQPKEQYHGIPESMQED